MSIEIVGKELTVCHVAWDGSAVRLCLTDAGEQEVALILPSSCAYQLLMTLPHLIRNAMSAQCRDRNVRLVFPLDNWNMEVSVEGHGLILTLATSDGFDVSFSLEPQTIKDMLRKIENSDLHLVTLSSSRH